MGVLTIIGLVTQGIALAANAAGNLSKIYSVVGDVFKTMAEEGRDEPTEEEIERVRAVYNSLRDDFYTDDERT